MKKLKQEDLVKFLDDMGAIPDKLDRMTTSEYEKEFSKLDRDDQRNAYLFTKLIDINQAIAMLEVDDVSLDPSAFHVPDHFRSVPLGVVSHLVSRLLEMKDEVGVYASLVSMGFRHKVSDSFLHTMAFGFDEAKDKMVGVYRYLADLKAAQLEFIGNSLLNGAPLEILLSYEDVKAEGERDLEVDRYVAIEYINRLLSAKGANEADGSIRILHPNFYGQIFHENGKPSPVLEGINEEVLHKWLGEKASQAFKDEWVKAEPEDLVKEEPEEVLDTGVGELMSDLSLMGEKQLYYLYALCYEKFKVDSCLLHLKGLPIQYFAASEFHELWDNVNKELVRRFPEDRARHNYLTRMGLWMQEMNNSLPTLMYKVFKIKPIDSELAYKEPQQEFIKAMDSILRNDFNEGQLLFILSLFKATTRSCPLDVLYPYQREGLQFYQEDQLREDRRQLCDLINEHLRARFIDDNKYYMGRMAFNKKYQGKSLVEQFEVIFKKWHPFHDSRHYFDISKLNTYFVTQENLRPINDYVKD